MSPAAAFRADSIAEHVRELLAAVALQHGLQSVDTAPFSGEDGWQCFYREFIYLCQSHRTGGPRFYLSEMATSLSPPAQEVWAQLRHELDAAFGAAAVYECTWTSIHSRQLSGGASNATGHTCALPTRRRT